ncbi:LEAF RUST 10 DISEASE-RESISTANCE LOCUS RECEPTOR-LIKE PROTEIN KINASE-like 2.8 [Rhodamnia argentea]|uniref:non-specific serine/threonine protein kinase n=1 Tax=Rhodamnia argentea TaxID=178133 RepID=A0ABM3HJR7_9MYRT|nr:LEAF RUST 10 DISEASE-RESISTANCE LOCUS RECEPTOR-LIKE PROTEIN KINASE-like 2.8 [Rhodamnia argentea]
MLIFLHQDKTRRKKMPNHHLLCILSPSLSLFFFFSFFASFHGGHSNFSPDCDPDVPPFLCGGFEIRFPFWNVTSDADVHCGYPGFGLHCPYGSVHPTLSLSGDSYYVTGINYDDKTLTLVDIDFVTDQGCPRARHNLKLESLPLEYNHSNVNLTFFFNCTAPLALAASIPALAIDCLKSGDNRTYVLVNNSPEEVAAFEKELRCEDAVVVAVKRTDVTMGNVLEEFAEAMREGFVLDWGTSKDCRKCEHSGRRCAVDEHEQLVCLCDDEKTHTGVSFCKASGKFAPFRHCVPYECGDQQISYPFRHHKRPSYCGYPGYELGCDHDDPILSMESLEYRVIHINMSTRILEVARMDLSGDICAGTHVQTTLDLSLFDSTPGDLNSTLFYGCNSPPPPGSFPFSCPAYGDGYFAFEVDPANPPHEPCNFSVFVPSLPLPPWEGGDDNATPSLDIIREFLKQGFEIAWIANTSQCESCTESGGRCGYDWKRQQFNCFCTDGAHSPACNGTRVPGSFPSSKYAYSHLLSGFNWLKLFNEMGCWA